MTPSTPKIILFTRYPVPGAAKTRLIPALGDHGAAALQKRMTERIAAELTKLPVHVAKEIWFEGAALREMEAWLGSSHILRQQPQGELGARMREVMRQSFSEGCCPLIFIGADCPTLLSEHLLIALGQLHRTDVVIGPANDGGYYLIGMRRHVPALFENIPWGGPQVLARTCEQAERLGLGVALLPIRNDIDRPEDLARLPAFLREATV
ncbi:MAG: TIGR04282 family arsenosugar biosynthesis glycosyltransferase [Thermodesulfobacteriota bacterium]